jgi:amino acid transporter
MQLERSLGTGGVLFASVGAMIGSGWLFGALYAAQSAGPAAILSWCIASVFIIIIALTFAEVAVMFPVSGGAANYSYLTHGRLAGFLIGWMTWLSFVVIAPIEVQATVQYMTNFFPSLTNKIGTEYSLTHRGYAVATILMLLLTYINSKSVSFMSHTNRAFSIWKIIVPAVAALIFVLSSTSTHNLGLSSFHSFAPNGIQGIFSALAIAGVIFSFNGFQVGILMAGEAKNPQKSIPIAIIGSILIAAAIYVFLQIAFILAVPQSSLNVGWTALHFSGDAGPLAGLSALLGIGWLTSLLYIDAVISPLGAGIVLKASSVRILFALSKNGYLPKSLQKLNKNKIPFVSLWINFAAGMITFLPFPGWQSMVAFLSSLMLVTFAIVPVCLLSLRAKLPDAHRPFKLPYPFLFSFLSFYICNLMLYWTGWEIVSKLLISFSIGLSIFVFQSIVTRKIRRDLSENKAFLWLLPYIFGMGILSYFGIYGNGKQIIPMGVDFAVIAAFSLFILVLSKALSLTSEKIHSNMTELLE